MAGFFQALKLLNHVSSSTVAVSYRAKQLINFDGYMTASATWTFKATTLRIYNAKNQLYVK